MLKKILQHTLFGIAWGCVCYIVAGLFANAFAGRAGLMVLFVENFRLNVLLACITGIGFSLPSMVYESDRLAMPLKLLIHFGVGMGIYLPCAWIGGWFPPASSPQYIATFLIAAVVFFFVIWSGFYFYHRHEAMRINEQLKKQQQQDTP